ncbi:MAG: ABC transporter permease, partial [Cyclobacteriaceae bacterium]|nr:ABC transporter permease [Cyclobacteriaceae bacterium]
NYIIIAWRNLWNNKVYSLINIVGLAVAMAACLLIYLYISFERSYDNFHEHGNNIYRLITTRTVDGVEEPSHSTLGSGYGPFLKSNLPEIEEFARLQIEDDTEFDFQYGPLENQSSREDKVFYADPSFLDMFSFPLLVGDATTALDEPNSIVITESLAKKYLGWNPQNDQPNDILDQSIIYNKTNFFKITGVAKDIPSNSHIKFNALISVETIKTSWWRGFDNEEGMGECILYYLLNPNTDVTALTEKIVGLFEKRYAESMKKLNITFSFQLQPIREIHLSSGDFKGEMEVRGDIRIVRFLIIICLFILAIAWTNYINLTTTRSMKRAKEVGIKKIVGAGKKQLIEQFLVESTMVNLIALLLAITMAQVLLPYFEQLIGKDLQVDLFSRELLIIISGFLVLGVFVSGLYPALLLSSFKSISMLSGIKNRGSNRAGLRKTLVVM